MAGQLHQPALHRSLSARLLVLTMAFVLISEVLIYVPSIARFRRVYLEERIAAAHLATLSLEATPDGLISEELEQELLSQAGVLSVILREPTAELMLGQLPPVEQVYDLRTATPEEMIRNAFVTLSLCAPSRSAFLTGRYNHANGVIDNHTPFPTNNVTHAISASVR